jgi:hypothetical protein
MIRDWWCAVLTSDGLPSRFGKSRSFFRMS